MTALRHNLTSPTPQIVAWSAATLAQAAYQRSPQRRKDLLESRGYHRVETVDRGGVQATIGFGRTHIAIAYAGTNDLDDVLADLNARRRPFLEGAVHGGALRQFEDTYPLIGAKTLIGYRLYIVGHSLGAMLAGITAAQLARMGVVISGVYLFGSPRFCDRRMAHLYDDGLNLRERTWRYVRCNDVVTRLPPPAPEWAMRVIHGLHAVRLAKWIVGYPAEYEVGDYRHVGRTVYLDSDDRVNRDATTKYVVADRLLARFKRPIRGISDHDLSTTVGILRRAANQAIRAGVPRMTEEV